MMKTFLLSTSLALGLGALALSPASAAPIVKSTVVASETASNAACRTVEKRVSHNGVTRITRKQECSGPRVVERRVYRGGDRRWDDRRYRHDRPRVGAPGLSIRVN